MQRAIARQAEAERERRAKVINAEGEYQAAARLAEAAAVIGARAGGAAAPLSADAGRDRDREQLDHDLPGAGGHAQGVHGLARAEGLIRRNERGAPGADPSRGRCASRSPGASRLIGSALAARLAAADDGVVRSVRRPARGPARPRGIRFTASPDLDASRGSTRSFTSRVSRSRRAGRRRGNAGSD